jgi:hypothetical protein
MTGSVGTFHALPTTVNPKSVAGVPHIKKVNTTFEDLENVEIIQPSPDGSPFPSLKLYPGFSSSLIFGTGWSLSEDN